MGNLVKWHRFVLSADRMKRDIIMKYSFYLSLPVCAALLTPGFASDEAYPEAEVLPEASDVVENYRMAGDWAIFANKTRGTCYMERTDDAGGAVQMGLTKSGEYGYIGMFVKGAEVEDEIKDIAISVNGNVYVGEANPATHLEGGYQGGYILSNNKDLRHDLGKADEMYAFPDAPYMVTVDLKGARNAIFEVRKCTEELQSS